MKFFSSSSIKYYNELQSKFTLFENIWVFSFTNCSFLMNWNPFVKAVWRPKTGQTWWKLLILNFILEASRLLNSNTGSLDLAQSKIFQFRILSKENGLFWPTEHSLTNLDVCGAVFIFYSCNSIRRKIESRLSPLHQLCLVFTI